jgi:kynurenine formamidase
MSLPEKLPGFDELPVIEGKPPRSAWGLFGEDDQVGTLNLLTAERVANAAKLVKSGKVFALNWELELPDPPLFGRQKLQHNILGRRWNVNDDLYNDFNPQSSSQWDGLTHFGHAEYGFYNGVQQDQVTGQPGTRNGIENWARRGIAGRAVLIDFERYAKQKQLDYAPDVAYGITAAEIQAAAEAQGVSFQVGDILLLRTGWITWYNRLNQEQREFLPTSRENYKWAGVEQTDEVLRFLWDTHFAAVASDCPSFESVSPPKGMVSLHATILGLWGMPIGEMFNLDPLAEDCAGDNIYEGFLTAAPLNKLGGVASPPNALVIK